ncbi:hypothetical protein [Streptomyces geranii]|uniref:hypothetical protein n=1 Tax=Streptomyces geranii TaxID=2058923 RepID=UPI001300177A|nr:hypothetical protein [Streptomyces geranii]
MTPPPAIDDEAKAQLEVVIELSRKLKGTSAKQLRMAMNAINYPARTERIRVYVDGATTAFGSVVSAAIVGAYLWVGYQMVLRDHVYACVLLCGIPVTSIASIFVLKKVLGSDVLSHFAGGRWLRNAPQPQAAAPIPAQAAAPDPAQADPVNGPVQ